MPVLPDSASSSDRRWNASTHSAISSIYGVVKGHRPLRQALQLAVGITPFVLLAPLNITKQCVCQEETMIVSYFNSIQHKTPTDIHITSIP